MTSELEPTEPSSETAELIKRIGQALADARRASGPHGTRDIEAIGVSYQQLQRYERGESRISVDRFIQIARALDVEPAELLLSALRGHPTN